jgi:cytidine deaminase
MDDMFKELIEKAKQVQGEFKLENKYSYAGSVGAAIKTQKGNMYTGICIDLPSGIGFCAEHSAVAEMLKNRETEIEAAVAVGDDKILPPCGRCREMMYQINRNNLDAKIIVDENTIVTLKELLPHTWI